MADTEIHTYTEFSKSSPEDVAYATVFWKSIALQPPMESRLISADIKQRLPVAPAPSQQKNYSFKPIGESPRVRTHIQNARALEMTEELQKIHKLATRRLEQLKMMHKRKAERLLKEAISEPYRPQAEEREKQIEMQNALAAEQMEVDQEAEQTQEDIQKFEIEHSLQ